MKLQLCSIALAFSLSLFTVAPGSAEKLRKLQDEEPEETWEEVAADEALFEKDHATHYEIGTPVYAYFGDCDCYVGGQLTDHDDNRDYYIVLFEDGDSREYSANDEELSEMVENASGNDNGDEVAHEDTEQYEEDIEKDVEDYEEDIAFDVPRAFEMPYSIKTAVYKNFEDNGGWWAGLIQGYNEQTGYYSIEYYADSLRENYRFDEDELMEIVENAAPPQIYPIGVEVYKEFSGEWYYGEIVEFAEEKATYTVLYEDGESIECADDNDLSMAILATYETGMLEEYMDSGTGSEEEEREEGER